MNPLNEQARVLRHYIETIDYIMDQYQITYAEASMWLNKRETLTEKLKETLNQLNSDS